MRTPLRHGLALFSAVAIGFLIAVQLGAAFLDAFVLIPFACLFSFFAAQSALNGAGVAAAMAHALALMITVLATAFGILNLDPPRDRLPDIETLVAIAMLAIATTYSAATLAPLLLRRMSGNAARWVLRGLMLAALLAYRFTPDAFTIAISQVANRYGLAGPTLAIATLLITATTLTTKTLQQQQHRK